MGKGRSNLQQAGVEALDEVDKEAEIYTLTRKSHIPIANARFLLLRSLGNKNKILEERKM